MKLTNNERSHMYRATAIFSDDSKSAEERFAQAQSLCMRFKKGEYMLTGALQMYRAANPSA